MMLFGAPAGLLLLLLAPLIGLVERVRFGAVAPGARALRVALIALLALSVAQPLVEHAGQDGPVVHVLDRSASIEPAAAEAVRAELLAGTDGLVEVDAEAQVRKAPGVAGPIVDPTAVDPRHTDLASGLRLADGLAGPHSGGRIVLWTDGGAAVDTDGIALPVDRRPLAALDRPRLVDLRVAPTTASPGQTLTVLAPVDGGAVGFSGEQWLSIGGQELLREALTVKPQERTEGARTVSLPADLAPGIHRIEAHLGEDLLVAQITVEAPPLVVMVGAAAGDLASLQALAQAEGMRVERLSPGALPERLAVGDVDVVLIADVPTRDDAGVPPLGGASVAALRDFVEEGGGLLLLGGPHAYDQGGYAESPLQALLPLKAVPAGKAREVPLSLLVVMDTSGSMARPVGGSLSGASLAAEMGGGKPVGSKIELADEAVAQSALRLRPIDRFGVIGVDTQVHWRLPFQLATSPRALATKVRKIGAGGGGIFVIDALQAAQKALGAEASPLRHVFFFVDAADAGEQWEQASASAEGVAREMAQDGVFLSVLALGNSGNKDAGRLQALAAAGGGRFRLAASPDQLTALFVEETERVRAPNLAEEAPFAVTRRGWHPALRGLDWSGAPLLSGRNKVEARPEARLLLVGPGGAPLFAAWRRGEGEVMAASFDAGARWAAAWTRWPGYGALWTQVLRHLARDTAAAAPQIEPLIEADGLHLRITLRDEAGERDIGARPTLTLGEGGPALALRLEEPGQWRVRVPLPENEEATVFLGEEGEDKPRASLRVVGPPRAERAERPAPVTSEDPRRLRATERTRLWPALLGLALALLPLDARLRRGLRQRTAAV